MNSIVPRILCLALIGTVSTSVMAQTPGLSARQPVGAYLNSKFPSASPGSGGGYIIEDAFPGVTFEDPVKMVPQPGSSYVWVITRQGKVWRLDKNSPSTTKKLILDIASNTLGGGDSGLLGIALHPQFGQTSSANRGYLYLYYNYIPDGGSGGKSFDRLSRFTLADGATSIARSSEFVLINQFDEHEWHNGGDLFFGSDSFLYLALGDEGELGEIYNNAQKINGGLFSGVLRIDVDRDPARSHAIRRQPQAGGTVPSGWPATYTQGYYIPNDNPWLDAGGSVLEEFFAIGLRSPHRMTFDAASGKALIGDVGQEAYEEVDLLVKGGNYQWSYREGTGAGPKAKPATVTGTETAPIYSYSHAGGGACVIGGYVYRGSRLPGSLIGKYIFGDYVSGRIWSLDWQTPGAQPVQLMQLAGSSLSGFSVDANNEIHLCTLGASGKIYRLSTSAGAPQPPATLSATGAFSNLFNLTPAAGVIPYDINSPLWTDGAYKQRWIAVPNDGAPFSGSEIVNFSATGSWGFPVGTVLIKQFDLGTNDANSAVRRRIETRFLVRGTDGWYGVTYKWRADGSDADLLVNGENMSVAITTTSGGTRAQNWTFPGRGDCMNCHTENAGFVLGPSTRQLNGSLTYPTTGITANQLATWSAIGMFDVPLTSSQIAGFTKAVPVTDTSASLELRVRSYIDSNCAHCHRPGGVRANMDARFDTPLAQANIVDGPLFNDLGVSGAKEVVAGDISRSMMHIRVNSLTDVKMPPLAKNVVDTTAVSVIAQWINSLTASQPALAGADVGDVGATGSTTGSSATGSYTLSGSGSGIYGTADAFRFAWTTLTGDGEIRARVTSQTNTNDWAKAGVMIRESADAGSRHAVCFLTPVNGFGYEFRAATNQPSEFFFGPAANAAPNNWVRLVRSGNSLSGYASANGQNWTLIYTGVVSGLQSTVRIGLVVTSSSHGDLSTAAFDNVQIIGGQTGANQAPVLAQPANQTTVRGAAASLQLAASDVDGGTLAYSASGLPAGLTINTAAGLINGTVSTGAAASYNVTVTVSDGALSNSKNFTWTTTSAPPAPPSLTGVDVGSVGLAGSSNVNATTGVFTVSGAGEDILFNADGFRFVYRSLQGDGEIKARVLSQTNTNPWAKAGVMIRENLTAGSRHAMMLVTPENGFGLASRLVANGPSDYVVGSALNPAPNNWVRLVRSGGTLTGYSSADGQSWTLVSAVTLSGLSPDTLIGLAVTATDSSQLSTAAFDNVQITGGTSSSGSLAGGDVGVVPVAGSTSFNATTGVYTVTSRTAGITGTADAFQFARTQLAGDGEVRARVTSLTSANPWAKAGVMIREDLTAGSRFGMAFVTTQNGFAGNYRLTSGGVREFAPGPALNAAPNNWVRVVRSGSVVTGFVSANGSAWTQIFATTLSSLASTVHFGLAVTSSDDSQQATATFDNVQIIGGGAPSNQAPVVVQPANQNTVRGAVASLQIQASDADGNTLTYSASGLPAGLAINASTGLISGTVSTSALATNNVTVSASDGTLSGSKSFTWTTTATSTSPTLAGTDIGAASRAGSTSYNSSTGVYSLSSSTSGIYQGADSFHFASTTLSGDGEIKARVTSLTNVNVWAKAGVMIREDLTAGSRFGLMFVTPQSGFGGNYRVTAGGLRESVAGPALNAAPNNWVRLVRVGGTLTGYASANGSTWTQVFATTLSNLASTVRIGLAVTPSDDTQTATAAFDNVSVTGGTSSPEPVTLAGSDVGTVGIAGGTLFNSGSGVYSVSSSGAGIMGTADAFHFAKTRLTGDGEIKARVTSLSNTNPWSKAGVMIREDLTAGSRLGLVFVTPQNGFGGNYRFTAGGVREYASAPALNAAPDNWVRLVRSGSVLNGFTSANGTAWTQIFSVSIANLSSSAWFGLAVTATDNSQLASATFDNVQVTGAPSSAGSQDATNTLVSLEGTITQPAGYPSNWNQWVGTFEIGATGDDGDYNSDLMEYALGEDPYSGLTAGGLKLVKREDGRWGASFRHPAAVSDVDYGIETSLDLVSWSDYEAPPITTDDADGIRSVTYAALDGLLGSGSDATVFVRLRVTHRDSGATAEGEPLSLQRISFMAGSQTLGWANVKPPLFAGRVSSAGGDAVHFQTTLAADAALPYYLEVRDGAYAGHRFDISGFSGTGATIDLASQRNTASALPDLTGASIVIRPHVTLDDLIEKTALIAGRSAGTADKVSFFANGGFVSCWLYNALPGDPTKLVWLNAGEATLANAGGRIVAPGEGAFLKSSLSFSMITGGQVRTNSFVRVLRPGSALLAQPWPLPGSAAGDGFSTDNGFIASRQKTTADQILFWRADSPGGAATYGTLWYAQVGTATYWVSADDATLSDQSAAEVILPHRAYFLKRAGTTTTTMLMPVTWSDSQ